MNLNDEEKQNCISAGESGFNAKQLAALLMFDEKEVKNALNDPQSEIYRYYNKGKVEAMIEPMKALKREACKGNVKAAKAMVELKNKNEVDQMINEFLGL